MDFRVRSFLAGAAKRDVELRDKAREDALSLAKDTLNYRAEIGMQRRKEKEAKLNNALRMGQNLMSNHHFKPEHIGVLATQGKLEQMHEWYPKLAADPRFKEGGLPTPDQVVAIAEDKPIDMPYEEMMRKIIIGTPMETKATQLDTSEMNRFQRSGAQAAAQFEKQFISNLGLDATQFNAYALDAFTPMRVEGRVFEEPFKAGSTVSDTRVAFKDAHKKYGPMIATALRVGQVKDAYGDFSGFESQGIASTEASMIASEAANRVVEYMRDEQLDYGRAVQKVEFELGQPGAIKQFYKDAQTKLGIEDPRPLQTPVLESASTVSTGAGSNAPLRSNYVLSNDARNNILRAETKNDIGRVIDSSFPGDENETLRRDLKSLLRVNNQKTNKQLVDIIDNYLGTGREATVTTTPADPDLNPAENPANRYNKPAEARPEAEPTQKLAPRMRKRPQPSKEEQDQAMQEIGAFTEELVAQGVDVNNPDEVKAAMLARNLDIPEEMIDTFASTIARYSAMQSRNQGIA